MRADLKALQELIDVLRSNGVTHYENGDVKIELGDLPLKPVEPAQKLSDDEKKRRSVERKEKLMFAHVKR